MASLQALVALSIDAMLPALSTMATELHLADSNHIQLVVSMLMLGMAIGLPFYGSLSDAIGRKPTVYLGLSFYALGCVISLISTSLTVMLIGRIFQGIGLAGPRVIVLALVRDQYKGDKMAEVMSIVMMVFILIPTVAPALGQLILFFFHWRSIFFTFLLIAAAVVFWFKVRQPETLMPSHRQAFSWSRTFKALQEIWRSPIALGYTVAAGLISGAFLSFLSTIEPILNQQFGLGEQFAQYFALLALFIGASSFLNSRLVGKVGMRRMVYSALIGLIGVALAYGSIRALSSQPESLWPLLVFLMATVFCVGILFGNLNALAMEPLGHIAGIGASVVSAVSTLISIPIGVFIGQQYAGNSGPLTLGFGSMGALTLLLVLMIERKR